MTQQNDTNNNKDGLLNDAGDIDHLIERLEQECISIESQEIIHDATAEELEDKGFIGEKGYAIKRSGYSGAIEHAGFRFMDTIDVAYKNNCKDISDIDPYEINAMAVVLPGQTIAVQEVKGKASSSSIKSVAESYDSAYREKAHLEIRQEENSLQFISTIKGKVIVINARIYIIPTDRDASCIVHISDRIMLGSIDLFPSLGSGKPLNKTAIINLLNSNKITAGIDEQAISKAIDKAEKEKSPLKDVAVAFGKKQIDGHDASVEFYFSVEETFEDFKIRPDGRVDYHRVANIPIVHKGDLLAKISQPGKGIDGYNIYGDVLKAQDGHASAFIPGENVTSSEDKSSFFAEADGQASLNGDVLSVFEHYFVDGDVDYNTGNIDFNGNVTVKGMVLAGFEVKASGDITIARGIESATVIAGRDLHVYGGIFGTTESNIVSCGRNLHAHHLQNATVEAQGDVVIDSSSIQSVILCNGQVSVRHQKGTIIGGCTNALSGVNAKTIGSAAGTKTEIAAGDDFLIHKTVKELQKTIQLYTANLHKIDMTLSPLLHNVQQGTVLDAAKKERVSLIIEKRKQIKKHLTIMESKHQDLLQKTTKNRSATIKAHEKIFPGVFLKICGYLRSINSVCDHCTFYLDQNKGEIEMGPY